jgi:hypothetical protein
MATKTTITELKKHLLESKTKGNTNSDHIIQKIDNILSNNSRAKKYDSYQLLTLRHVMEMEQMKRHRTSVMRNPEFQEFIKNQGIKINKNTPKFNVDDAIMDFFDAKAETAGNYSGLSEKNHLLYHHLRLDGFDATMDDLGKQETIAMRRKTKQNKVPEYNRLNAYNMALRAATANNNNNNNKNKNKNSAAISVRHDEQAMLDMQYGRERHINALSYNLEKKLERLALEKKKTTNSTEKAKVGQKYLNTMAQLMNLRQLNNTNNSHHEEDGFLEHNNNSRRLASLVKAAGSAPEIGLNKREKALYNTQERIKGAFEQIKEILDTYKGNENHFNVEQYRNQANEKEYVQGLYTDIRDFEMFKYHNTDLQQHLYNLYIKYKNAIPANKNKRVMIQAHVQLDRYRAAAEQILSEVDLTIQSVKRDFNDIIKNKSKMIKMIEADEQELQRLEDEKRAIDKKHAQTLKNFLQNEKIVKYKVGHKRDLFIDTIRARMEEKGQVPSQKEINEQVKKARAEVAALQKKHKVKNSKIPRLLAMYIHRPIRDIDNTIYMPAEKKHKLREPLVL